MTYRRHGSYLPVESAWLREVPASWRYSPLWPYFQVIEDRAGNDADSLELLSVSQTLGVLPRSAISDKEPRADDLSNYRHCRAGDVIINRMSAYQGAVGVSPQEGIVSPDYLVLRCSDLLRPGFLVHLLKSSGIIGEIVLRLRGIGTPGAGTVRTPRIGASELGRISIPLPSIGEQDTILTALGRETSQIDDLIGKQERLIELLAEKRQAIITRAVTKGLDPTALTKPSGEPWIGDVPEHWSLPRLKNCSQVKRGRFMHRPRNSPHLYDGKYPFIQTGAIARAQGKYITEYSQTLSEAGLETSALMPQGTLVMAIAANIADVALLSFDSCAPDSVLGFQPTNLTSPDFLYYALTAKRAELISEAPVTSQGNLNVERVGGVTIPLPPVREQQNIVKKLDEELEQMAQISAKASGMLRLLIERRSALISAAVTGKIDVRKRAS